MLHKIKDDAIFIADSHYNRQRIEFEVFIDNILDGKIITSELFLMGDMFDFLSYDVEYFKNINRAVIDKLNRLALKIDIIYLEGNHDFNLDRLFTNILIIPRDKQPYITQYKDKKIALSHGDIFTPFFYDIFCSIFRNHIFQMGLNKIDLNNTISQFSESFLIGKKICNSISKFDSFAQNRLKAYQSYDVDIVIEGHFHQGKRYKNYINIPSYACDEIYYQNNISVNLL